MVRADVQRLRSLITAQHPRRIQVASTHNHEGPDSIGYWGPGLLIPVARGVDEEWLDKSLQAIALGVNEAIRTAQPVRLGVGEIEVEPGWADNIWFPPGQGPIDRRMGVIRLDRRDGTPQATIVNWACHAETLLSINEQVSADYPGRLCKHLEQRGGGVAMFFNGALGGMISPRICRFDERGKWSNLAARIKWMDQMGDRLAELAMTAAQQAPRESTARIAVRSSDVTVPIRNALFVAMARRRILPVGDTRPEAAVFRSEVGLVKIGGAWLAMVPGEPFPRLGQLLKEAMPFARPPMVVGLANDELAYMMMPEQWDDDHYDYERSMSTGPQTGRLVYEAFLGLLAQER
jgi:hypothetical protein